jgi:hypothetical protein
LSLGNSIIAAAVAWVDRDMVTRVWDEMDYRIDFCLLKKFQKIVQLWGKKKKKKKKNLARLPVFQYNKIWYPLRSLFTLSFLNVSQTNELMNLV